MKLKLIFSKHRAKRRDQGLMRGDESNVICLGKQPEMKLLKMSWLVLMKKAAICVALHVKRYSARHVKYQWIVREVA